MPLTGRFSFRRAVGGKIVLQVEEEVRRLWPFSRWHPTKRRWRDATLMDLTQRELRPLMDLRYKPGLQRAQIYGQLNPAWRAGDAGARSEDCPSTPAGPRQTAASLTVQPHLAA
jgi:hypothetical protein